MTTPPAPDPKTPPAAAGPADGEADRIATIDQKIAAAVGQAKDDIIGEVRKLVGGARTREGEHLTDPGQSRGERAAAAGKSLDDMIAGAIKVNDEQRAKDAADADLRTKLEAATAEKPPVDRRRVHRIMGWGDPPQ